MRYMTGPAGAQPSADLRATGSKARLVERRPQTPGSPIDAPASPAGAVPDARAVLRRIRPQVAASFRELSAALAPRRRDAPAAAKGAALQSGPPSPSALGRHPSLPGLVTADRDLGTVPARRLRQALLAHNVALTEDELYAVVLFLNKHVLAQPRMFEVRGPMEAPLQRLRVPTKWLTVPVSLFFRACLG